MSLAGSIRAELSKLLTARSTLAVCLLAVGLCYLVSVISGFVTDFDGNETAGRDFADTGQLTVFFTLILGTLTIGGEFRHGSIAPSLLVTPPRARFLTGKLIALVIVSLAIGTLSVAGCVLIAAIILPAQDIALNLSGSDFLDAVLSTAIVAPLWALVGFAVACILRNQTGAIILILVWIFVVESIVGSLWSAFTPYALSNSLGAAAGSSDVGIDDPLSQAQALVVSAAYIGVLLTAGWAVMQRSDITG